MKKLILSAALACAFFSCSEDADVVTNELNESAVLATKSTINIADIPSTAKLLSMIEINKTTIEEVKSRVSKSIKYGLGESARFTDIIHPENSKIYKIPTKSALYESLYDVCLNLKEFKDESKVKEYLSLLSNTDLEILWPYAEDWKGEKNPFIAFVSDDQNYIYRPKKDNKGTFYFDTIAVTADYIKNNPVWIISESSMPYDKLPDFEKGEFTNKDGMFFYSDYAIEKTQKRTRAYEPGVYLATMRTTEAFESGLGGSNGEFYFYWLNVDNGRGGYTSMYRRINSSEVNDELQLNYKIRSPWGSAEVTNGLIIYESDGGKDKTGSRTLIYNNGTGNKNIPVSFPYQKNDDFILDKILYQTSICGDDNFSADGSLKKYYGKSNFWITIAVK